MVGTELDCDNTRPDSVLRPEPGIVLQMQLRQSEECLVDLKRVVISSGEDWMFENDCSRVGAVKFDDVIIAAALTREADADEEFGVGSQTRQRE